LFTGGGAPKDLDRLLCAPEENSREAQLFKIFLVKIFLVLLASLPMK
jgi:hypothetical protein